MFIKIKELNEEAISTLKKAAPYQGPERMTQSEYVDAFQEFSKVTNFKYLDGGFNAFETAVLSYRRKKDFNPYKSDEDDIVRKVELSRRDYIKKCARGAF
jgi:hypothetical protein